MKLLFALGKVATAGLAVSGIGLGGQLGKIGLSVGPAHKGGIAIDIGGGHHHKAQPHSHHKSGIAIDIGGGHHKAQPHSHYKSGIAIDIGAGHHKAHPHPHYKRSEKQAEY